MILKATEP